MGESNFELSGENKGKHFVILREVGVGVINWTSQLGKMQTFPLDNFLVCCYKVLLCFNHFILPCLLEGGGAVG